MEHKNSLHCSQDQATVPYPETDDSSSHPLTVTLRFVFDITLPYMRRVFVVKWNSVVIINNKNHSRISWQCTPHWCFATDNSMVMDADKVEVRLSPWLLLRYRSDIRLEEVKETTLTRCVSGRWCRVCRRGRCCPRPGRSQMRREGGSPAAESPPQQWRAVATRITTTTSRRQSSVECTSCSVSYTAFLVSSPAVISRFMHVQRGRFRSMLFLQLSTFMDSVLGYAVYAAHFLLLEEPPASEVFNFLRGWGFRSSGTWHSVTG